MKAEIINATFTLRLNDDDNVIDFFIRKREDELYVRKLMEFLTINNEPVEDGIIKLPGQINGVPFTELPVKIDEGQILVFEGNGLTEEIAYPSSEFILALVDEYGHPDYDYSLGYGGVQVEHGYWMEYTYPRWGDTERYFIGNGAILVFAEIPGGALRYNPDYSFYFSEKHRAEIEEKDVVAIYDVVNFIDAE